MQFKAANVVEEDAANGNDELAVELAGATLCWANDFRWRLLSLLYFCYWLFCHFNPFFLPNNHALVLRVYLCLERETRFSLRCSLRVRCSHCRLTRSFFFFLSTNAPPLSLSLFIVCMFCSSSTQPSWGAAAQLEVERRAFRALPPGGVLVLYRKPQVYLACGRL